MSPENFVYWLNGYFEIRTNKDAELTKEQVKIIQNHLNLVFFHSIDPETYGEDGGVSQALHDGVRLSELYRQNPHLDPNKDWGDEPIPKC